MLDTITKQRGDGHLSMTEEAWHWDRAADATDRLLALLIERHADDPSFARYASRQIAKPAKPVAVPTPSEIPNPAPSDTASDGLALRLIAEPEACGATPIEWVSAQDYIPPASDMPVSGSIRGMNRVATIINAASRHSGVAVSEIISPRHSVRVTRPRHIGMFLSKTLTDLSYPIIARRFGNRDHTTVISAVSKITRLLESDQQLAEDVAAIMSLAVAADPGLAQ